jgi:hypothetical protein
MRMQMEVHFVSRKATIGGFATNPTRPLLLTRLKPTEIIYCPLGSCEIVPAISFYDGQISFNDGTHNHLPLSTGLGVLSGEQQL